MKTGTPTIRPSSIVHRPRRGFTLVELLVTLAVVVILISAAARLGAYVRTRAAVQLAESALAVIDTALEQYYTDFNAFPPMVVNETQFEGALGIPPVPVTISSGVIPDGDPWSSAALFYFLGRHPNSRSIIGALTNTLITNKDAAGTTVLIQIPAGSVGSDFVRFIDPWGTSLRYEYVPLAHAFPRVVSAGPDKIFGTPDDIINK